MDTDKIADSPLVQAWRRNDEYAGFTCLADDLKASLLHKNQIVDGNLEEVLCEFDALFEYNSLPKGTILYRGTSRLELGDFLELGEMIYPTYMSTSEESSIAANFFDQKRLEGPILLEIVLEEDVNVLDASSKLFGGVEEKEFIFPRNVKLQVLSKTSSQEYKVGLRGPA